MKQSCNIFCRLACPGSTSHISRFRMLSDVDVLPMIHVAAREEESKFPCTANPRQVRMHKSLDEDDDQLTDAAAVHDTCSFAPDRVGQTSRHAFSTVMNAVYARVSIARAKMMMIMMTTTNAHLQASH